MEFLVPVSDFKIKNEIQEYECSTFEYNNKNIFCQGIYEQEKMFKLLIISVFITFVKLDNSKNKGIYNIILSYL